MDIYAIVCMSRFRQQTDALAMARVDKMNIKPDKLRPTFTEDAVWIIPQVKMRESRKTPVERACKKTPEIILQGLSQRQDITSSFSLF